MDKFNLSRNKNLGYILLMVFFFILSLLNFVYLFKVNYLNLRQDYEKRMKLYEVLVYSLGNIRYTLAAYFWIRTELFIHYSGLVTINDLPEIVYYARLITILNPNFVDAYDFGAFQLAFFLNLPHKGLDFIKEGIKNNPNEYKLYFTAGMIYSQKIKDYSSGYKCFNKSLELINKNKIVLSNQENLELYKFLAYTSYELKKYKEAFYYYNESIRYSNNKELMKKTKLY